MSTLRETFLEELAEVHDAEKQIMRALPKMAEAAQHDSLKRGFEEHVQQTGGQVERLEQVFEALGEKRRPKKAKAMQELIKEGEEFIKKGSGDAALISAAQKVEHYEIAAYDSLLAWARRLGEREAAELIEATLDEENLTNSRLALIRQGLDEPQVQEMFGSQAGWLDLWAAPLRLAQSNLEALMRINSLALGPWMRLTREPTPSTSE